MQGLEKNDLSLSVLCADVAGGILPPKYFDQPEMMYAMGRREKRIRRSVESYGGQVINSVGGKLLAFFPQDVDALHAALEMRQRIADLPPSSGLPMAIRVGICTGHQLKEVRYFPRDGANPATNLSAVADPGHILFSIPRRVLPFPWVPLVSDSLPDLSIRCGSRQLGVFQVAQKAHDPAVLRAVLAGLGNQFEGLKLRYKGVETVLDEHRPILKIGRQLDNDLVVRDKRCSRLHCTIELHGDRFFFVDRSSNGTFVTFENREEVLVHRKELVLFGRGKLSFGAPSSADHAELLHFQTSNFVR